MKKYEFVSVKAKNNVVKDAEFSGYKDIISEYAEKGYGYVGFIPSLIGPSGKIVIMDLVFETEV